MIGSTLRTLFRKDSPFSIRPRLDPALWSWLIHFARRCNRRDMMEAGRGIQPLLESSLALYQELVDHEGLECEWERRGLLFVFRASEPMDAYAETNIMLWDVAAGLAIVQGAGGTFAMTQTGVDGSYEVAASNAHLCHG